METMEIKWWNWKWFAVGAAGFSIVMLKRYLRGRVCTSKALLEGKTVIITGANSGIGKATACELAKRKAKVILACRDSKKAEAAVKEIRRSTNNGELVIKELDLASLTSVRQFANEIKAEEASIDVLINNAGVFQCPYEKTEDGFEMQFQVNHLGNFLLTNLLLEKLKASAPSRVVFVSSSLHVRGTIDFDNLNFEKGYDRRMGYNNSKLASNLFARELAKRTEGTGLGVFCLHPGMVNTNLGRYVKAPMVFKIIFYALAWIFIKSPWEGCQTVLHCAIDEDLNGVTKAYYGNCEEKEWTAVSSDDDVAAKLWDVSAKLTGL